MHRQAKKFEKFEKKSKQVWLATDGHFEAAL